VLGDAKRDDTSLRWGLILTSAPETNSLQVYVLTQDFSNKNDNSSQFRMKRITLVGTLKMKAICSSETSVLLTRVTRRHIQDRSILRSYRHAIMLLLYATRRGYFPLNN
jgi:hypothetical protein